MDSWILTSRHWQIWASGDGETQLSLYLSRCLRVWGGGKWNSEKKIKCSVKELPKPLFSLFGWPFCHPSVTGGTLKGALRMASLFKLLNTNRWLNEVLLAISTRWRPIFTDFPTGFQNLYSQIQMLAYWFSTSKKSWLWRSNKGGGRRFASVTRERRGRCGQWGEQMKIDLCADSLDSRWK